MAIIKVNNFILDAGPQEVLGDVDAFLAGESSNIVINYPEGARGAEFGRLFYTQDLADVYKIKFKSSVPMDTVVQYYDGDTLKDFGTLNLLEGGYYEATGAIVITESFGGLVIYQEENSTLENMVLADFEAEDNNGNSILTHEEDDGTFELPRKDWYDAEGRIYKDALIENFNAIEQEFIRLANVDKGIGDIPSPEDVEYLDSTLNSDERTILNLRSFLTIMNLINYPVDCRFDGKKLVRLAYWNSDGQYKEIINQNISCNTSSSYIYLNYSTNTVSSSSSATTPANSKLIGRYVDSKIVGLYSEQNANINILYYLAKMREETYDVHFSRWTREQYDDKIGIVKNNRTIGTGDTNKYTGPYNDVTFRDIGRAYS